MSNPIVKLFIGIAELLLIIIGLRYLFHSYTEISGLMTAADRQKVNMQAENASEDLLPYAGASISGTDVIMLVKEAGFYNICVTVNNGSGSINYYYTDFTLSNHQADYESIISGENSCLTKKISGYEQYYISPIDTYNCELVLNENEVIVGIVCNRS